MARLRSQATVTAMQSGESFSPKFLPERQSEACRAAARRRATTFDENRPGDERRPYSPAPLGAVLLAAGRSMRMGRDKALLEVDGTPLWQRQREVLAETGAGEIYLSARPEQAWTKTAKGFAAVVHDAFSHGGPLVGIAAGLERSTTPWLAVLAIDLPQMTPEWFAKLGGQCRPGVGAVGRQNGFFEPLAAIYPREILPLAWEALVHGQYALQPLLARAVTDGLMRVHEITPAEAPWFENWNEPQDF
jgi:molybdopterin-guanine dinucleotide biosynthesis protein A